MDINPLFQLDNKTVFVTGASSGIGKHCALFLAQCGAKVAVASRRIEQLKNVVDEITRLGGEAKAFTLDVTNKNSVVNCFDELVRWSIPTTIINNAGVSVNRKLLDQTEEDWDQVIDTNLKGCWLVATEATRRLVAANIPGNIVNIASILGERVIGGVAP